MGLFDKAIKNVVKAVKPVLPLAAMVELLILLLK